MSKAVILPILVLYVLYYVAKMGKRPPPQEGGPLGCFIRDENDDLQPCPKDVDEASDAERKEWKSTMEGLEDIDWSDLNDLNDFIENPIEGVPDHERIIGQREGDVNDLDGEKPQVGLILSASEACPTMWLN